MNQKFGGPHTEQKLNALEKYLKAYITALKGQPFRKIYFDAFAGTGGINISKGEMPLFQGENYDVFVQGSVQRALKFGTHFDRYIFVEAKRKKSAELRKLLDRYAGLQDRVDIITGDANEELKRFCGKGRRDWRAVVFLDPYGNQVDWDTIATLGATEAVDLWYLFPAGLGVARQIGKDGTVHYTHGPSLDRIFGTPDWREEFIQESHAPDLFDSMHRSTQKVATPDSITRYMINRMTRVFRGGVLDDWLPLGANGIHMYSLIFACANPRGTAASIAMRLAAGVIRSERRGRT
jgi:three-Cys-motif partner protein